MEKSLHVLFVISTPITHLHNLQISSYSSSTSTSSYILSCKSNQTSTCRSFPVSRPSALLSSTAFIPTHVRFPSISTRNLGNHASSSSSSWEGSSVEPQMTSPDRPEARDPGADADDADDADSWLASKAVDATTRWIRDIVLILHLCPFAAPLLSLGEPFLRITANIDASSPRSVKQAMWKEIHAMARTLKNEEDGGKVGVIGSENNDNSDDDDGPGQVQVEASDSRGGERSGSESENEIDPRVQSSLLVLPNAERLSFVQWNRLCESIEDDLESNEDLVDLVFVTFFHPFYQYGDVDELHDPAQFDRRAPYPVMNVLRVDQLDQYIEQGKTQDIVKNNQNMLAKMHSQDLIAMYEKVRPGLYTEKFPRDSIKA